MESLDGTKFWWIIANTFARIHFGRFYEQLVFLEIMANAVWTISTNLANLPKTLAPASLVENYRNTNVPLSFCLI